MIGFHKNRWQSFATAAISGGAEVHLRAWGTVPHVLWDCAGNCERPVHRELYTAKPLQGRFGGPASRYDVVTERTGGRTIELQVRCRKCRPCLRVRAFQWRIRAVSETRASERTWFGTLTLSANEQARAFYAARRRLAAAGTRIESLSVEEQLFERHKEVSGELTRWLKRVRKESNAPLRYMLVMEAHKSGMPHYHCLIHELDASMPVRHHVLTRQWKLGFTKFNLVDVDDPAAAGYVCKYLSKSLTARVRASKGYGHRELVTSLDVVKRVKEEEETLLTPFKNYFLKGTDNDEQRRLSSPRLPGGQREISLKCRRHEARLSNAAPCRSDTGGAETNSSRSATSDSRSKDGPSDRGNRGAVCSWNSSERGGPRSAIRDRFDVARTVADSTTGRNNGRTRLGGRGP